MNIPRLSPSARWKLLCLSSFFSVVEKIKAPFFIVNFLGPNVINNWIPVVCLCTQSSQRLQDTMDSTTLE